MIKANPFRSRVDKFKQWHKLEMTLDLCIVYMYRAEDSRTRAKKINRSRKTKAIEEKKKQNVRKADHT